MTKGFTLIELMLAIAIIAILVAVISPHFSETRNQYELKREIIESKEVCVDRNGREVMRELCR